YFIQAIDFDNRGMPEMATHYYRLASAFDPASEFLRESLAQHYLALGKFGEALLCFKDKGTPQGLSDNAKRIKATVYLKMHQLRNALEALEAIQKPTDEEFYSIGLLHEALGNTEKAGVYYLRYLDKNPQSLDMGLKVIRLDIRNKHLAQAESLAVHLSSLVGEKAPIFNELGVIKMIKGDTLQALNFFKMALDLDSNNQEALRNRAAIALQKNDYAGGVHFYEKLYRGQNLGALYGKPLALLYYYNDQLDSASALLRRLLSDAIDDYELHFYLGLVFYSRDSLDMARLEFEKTLDLRNTFEDAWRQICLTALKQKKTNDALALAQRYTAALSASGRAWRTLGYVRNMRKEYALALPPLTRAITLNDTDATAFFELGLSYERLKKIDSAAIMFGKVLRLQPDDAVAANYLGYMWADAGVYLDSAQILIQSALKKDSGNGAYLDSYAWVLFKRGDIAGAYRYMKTALDIFSDDPVLFLHWGEILQKKGDRQGALRAFHRCLEMGSEDSAAVQQKIHDLEILNRAQPAVAPKTP
ncbi:MAG: tetratricopeptide repeat protein, partial [Chitinivibrionales bacterium]|nr:tetratricopeptide repeat protein [Chitinivibrionales bacterium]